jgi:hypothetical protein
MMKIENSSFRDKDGFVFYVENTVFRQINSTYFDNYELLIQSGLYQRLIEKKYLIKHEEVPNFIQENNIKTIKPELIPFVSYPYEWSFTQLKKAALLTLNIQLEALKSEMSLKDATAYNVQFFKGKPIFIDTLSFEKYNANSPWQAYKQFCQHFLNPLCLASYGYQDSLKLMQIYIDGIPLELTSKMLPFKSKFNLGIYSHIHLNAKYERKYKNDVQIKNKTIRISKKRQISIIEHLKIIIKNLTSPKSETNWTNYYEEFSYNSKNIEEKKSFVEKYIAELSPNFLIDSGSNAGLFSVLCSKYAKNVISFDFDQSVIDYQFKSCLETKIKNILPLVIDITNPSPPIGWYNTERKSFIERLPNNSTTLALALIHHLCLSFNLTFEQIALFYARFSEFLIIEFVPKYDSQSQKLLITKKDVFNDYTKENFIQFFSKYFEVIEELNISDTERILYKMKRK